MPTNDLDMDEFFREFDNFKADFKSEIETAVYDNNYNDMTWKDVRDSLLCHYPMLNRCYEEHKAYHDLDYDMQSRMAKLGRKIAGAMGNILREVVGELPGGKHEPAPTRTSRVTELKPNGARWAKRSQIMNASDAPAGARLHSVASIAVKNLALSISQVKPGEAIVLYYPTMEELRHDQVLVDDATSALKWQTDPRYRAFTTWTVQEGPMWGLVIEHLTEQVVRRGKK